MLLFFGTLIDLSAIAGIGVTSQSFRLIQFYEYQ